MAKSTPIATLAVLLAALLACKSEDPPPPPAPTIAAVPGQPAVQGAQVQPQAPAQPMAPTPPPTPPAPAPAPAATVDAKGVPLIPSTRSKPPTVAEWNSGLVVNTQGAGNRSKACELRIVREWLRVSCHSKKITGYEKMSGFGAKNNDYYEMVKPGKLASFVLRLKKGRYPKIRICQGNTFSSLFVSWPAAAERPKNIAMADIGRACDRGF